MRKKIMTAVVALATTAISFAEQPYETLETTDGSIYMGHTIGQDFKNKNPRSLFLSDSAILVTPMSKVISLTSESIRLEDLNSQEWKDWFKSHPSYIKTEENGRRVVKMHRIVQKGQENSGLVFLLEKSPTHLKYYSKNSRKDTILDKNIKSTIYALTDPRVQSGVTDIIYTSDNEFHKGQIVSQDNQFVGLKTEAGFVELIPNGSVVRTITTPLNPDQSLEEQVRYLDKLLTKEGSFTGIITERNIKPGNEVDPYYVIYDIKDKISQKVNLKDISGLAKIKNDKYSPIAVVVLEDEEDILANGVKLNSINYVPYSDAKRGLNGLVIKEKNRATKLNSLSESLNLYMRDMDLNSMIYLIKVSPLELNDKDLKSVIYFSYQELLDKARVPSKKSISKNGNKIVSYTLTPGIYLLYRSNDKKAFLINLEN